MKKSLIILAVLSACGAATAQSSVTLYGVADAWVGTDRDTRGATFAPAAGMGQMRVGSGGLSTSRWGLRGTEDLGGGLKADFNLEQSLNLDTGATGTVDSKTAFDRAANVGVSGNFGAVKLGRMATPYYDLRHATDAISAEDSSLGVARTVFLSATGATGLGVAGIDYTERTSNTIAYVSPTYSGVSGAVAYSFGENKTTALKAANAISLKLQYAAGPLLAGYGYQDERGQNTALLPNANDKKRYHLFAGSYDFGVAKLVASYQQAKFSVTSEGKAKDFQAGVSVPVGANASVTAAYAQAKFDAAGAATDIKANGYSVVGNYRLSKRTDLYAGYKLAKKKTEAGVDLGDTRLVAAGVRHSF